jgi:hypothetical protein
MENGVTVQNQTYLVLSNCKEEQKSFKEGNADVQIGL